MTEAREGLLASQVEIFVGGTKLQLEEISTVDSVRVEQHTHLPAYFEIRIYDKDFSIIDGSTFDLAKEVEIKGYTASGTATSLMKGEIVAIEPMFGEGMVSYLIVSGYDKSHRLYREPKSQAFLNIKDSDLASQIAGSAGLSAQTDATSTVYDHLYQDNQTDMSFLRQRAWRIGYECFVEDGKLYFRKPPSSGTTATLKWGQDLISFRPRMTLAEQVDEVQIRGWDPKKLEAIVGKSTSGKLYPSSTAGGQHTKAGEFGTGKHILVDLPVVTQAEADKVAEARMNEISGAFIEAEGQVFQRPDVAAGKFVELEGVGTKFSGKYFVTTATHQWSKDGLVCQFTARGSRTGLLADEMLHERPLNRWPGVVTAIVTNTEDPESWGRIKIKYPWMTDDAESWWARLAAPGAGPEAGFIAIPDVDDEVLIAFEHGDFNSPVVIGGLWNGKHATPPSTAGAAAGEQPLVRTWQSRNGHFIAMHDDDDQKVELITTDGHQMVFDDTNKKVEITTAGGHSVTMDDQGKTIEISSSGGHKIVMDDNGRKIEVSSVGDIEIKAASNMKLQANANIDVNASGMVNIKGSMVNIN